MMEGEQSEYGQSLNKNIIWERWNIKFFLSFVFVFFIVSLVFVEGTISNNIVSYYKFDEQDITGSGTIIDELGVYNGANDGADNSTGKINTGYRFVQGNKDNITIDKALGDILDGDFTISLWYQPDNTGAVEWMFHMRNAGGTQQGIVINTEDSDDGNGLRFFVDLGGTTKELFKTGDLRGAFHHVVVRRDGTNLTLWFDGSLTDTDNNVGNDVDLSPVDTNIYFGSEPGGGVPFDGLIDEVGFWERALTNAEVIDLYNNSAGLAYPFGDLDTTSPNVTNLTEYPTDPATYSQSTVYQFNATIIDGGTLDDIIFEFNGTNYTATTLSANIYNVSFTNLSVGVYNYRWFANDSLGNVNSTETGSYTINKSIPQGSLTSDLGWTINETQEVTIGLSESNYGDDDVTYIVSRDNVSKATGETWTPSYGTYHYVLNTTGGVNWTKNISMDTQTLTVNDNINPNIAIVFPTATSYISVITELNYTISDTNLNTCWYSLDGGLVNTTITCGDNVTGLNSGQGSSTWQVWANDSDNNINTSSVTFNVDSINPNVTSLTEYPTDPATYSQSIVYQFNATIIDGGNLDYIIFEFNGTNYTATNLSANVYNVSFTNLSVGVYNYRWFANDSLGNVNSTETGSYTINQATPSLSLTASTPITYGTVTDFSGSGCPTQLSCSLDIANNVYAAGTITGNYSTAGNVNYTSAYANFTVTINKAPIIGSITGTSPITYGAAGDVVGNESNNNDSDIVYTLYRDGVLVSNPDTTTLGAGAYNYIYNATGGQNYSANVSIDTFTLTVDKEVGEVYAYINNSRANYRSENFTSLGTYLNGTLETGAGTISMYLNNTLINSSGSSLINIRDLLVGSYYLNVTYGGNDNYTSAEEHWSINISIWYPSVLIGTLNLDEDTGAVAYDISKFKNNGTVSGATWSSDNITITLTDNLDYSINKESGLFVLLEDLLERKRVNIIYTYFEYDTDGLAAIVVKLLPGLLLMLLFIMIIKIVWGRRSYNDTTYIYEY